MKLRNVRLQGVQSRYCVTPVIQVTAHRLCLSCGTNVIAIETDDRLLTGYKWSMIGYGKKRVSQPNS